MDRWTRRAAAVALSLTVASTLDPAAWASHGGGWTNKRGSCSAAADWKLKARLVDGRVEVRAKVESGRAGQRWHWRILHDGAMTARGTAKTRGAGGTFEIERTLVDAPAKDHIGWRASNPRSGETCRGGLSI